jgi:hypothetical protein
MFAAVEVNQKILDHKGDLMKFMITWRVRPGKYKSAVQQS